MLLCALIVFAPVRCHKVPEFDVAIIGGGLAGLAAASELSELRIVLLEKDNRLGGRVQTLQRFGINFEAGALFAYDPRILRGGFTPSEFISGAEQMALRHSGRTLLCRHATQCLEKAVSSKDEIRSARHWLENDSADYTELFPEAYQILNGFFRAIHPGQLAEYWIKGRSQVFSKIPNGRYSGGNKELTEFLSSRINSGSIRTGTEVSEIDDRGNFVEIRLSGEHSIIVRKVICATDGITASRILKHQRPASQAWLKKLLYKGGVSVNLGLTQNPFPGIGYIVNASERFHVFYVSPQKNSKGVVLTGYRATVENEQSKPGGSEQMIHEALNSLKTYGVNMPIHDLLFSHVRAWEKIGVVTSRDAYAEWTDDLLAPSENVYLAGDYTFVDPNMPMPYGISAAVLSGYRAADSLRRQLGKI